MWRGEKTPTAAMITPANRNTVARDDRGWCAVTESKVKPRHWDVPVT